MSAEPRESTAAERRRGPVRPVRPAQAPGAAGAEAQDDLPDQLFRAMEAMPAALLRLSRDWTVCYLNGHAETILGRGRHELVGRDLRDVVPELVGSTFGGRTPPPWPPASR